MEKVNKSEAIVNELHAHLAEEDNSLMDVMCYIVDAADALKEINGEHFFDQD